MRREETEERKGGALGWALLGEEHPATCQGVQRSTWCSGERAQLGADAARSAEIEKQKTE
jgi:hypothetical protein